MTETDRGCLGTQTEERYFDCISEPTQATEAEKTPNPKVKTMANVATSVLSTAGTAMFSMGMYFHKESSRWPHITGMIVIPAAMAGWGVVIAALSVLLQAPARLPKRLVVGVATILVALTASGTALTSVAAASEASDIDDVITDNLDKTVLMYGDESEVSRELDFIQVN